MRAAKSKGAPPSWFRIENAHVDEESATDEVTTVYIYDTIGDSWWDDSTSASEFIKQLSNIKTPRIELHLNSPGGDIFDGVAIYNALKAHPAQVTVIVDALAASAASFIAQAGDEIVMTKAATMMIHDGSAMAWGPASVMRETADLLDKLSNTVAEIYSDRAGQNIEFWRNLMIEETWYNSHEAVDAGLADRIGEDTKKEDDEAAQNKWDLSIFNYAGRSRAQDPMQVRQRIANRLKEMTVGNGPQNSEGQPEEQQNPPGSPDVDPDAQTTEEESDEQAAGPGVVPNPPTPAVQPEATPENQARFTLQGQPTNDFTAVQNRLNFLEEFRNETIKSGKVSFVEKLAADNKILASQVTKLTAYALSLSDEGYSAWKDTWDGSPALPMLAGSHAEGTTNHAGSQTEAADTVAAELETKKGIVNQHRLSGMSEDKIKNTPSYKRVMELDPTFKL
jgi:ATP-dependent protease ClpP protease subunit